MRKSLALLLGLMVLPLAMLADSSVTRVRTVTKLAEGVYEIRHPDAPDTFPQSNTMVVIGDRDVLVVDSCYLPSSAKEDIAQIKQWTNKPVRYLVNTHWHFDHTMGNSAYAEAFPELMIIAHRATRDSSVGFNPGWFERFPQRAEQFKKVLADGKDNQGRALSEQDRKDYEKAIAGITPVHEEFKKINDRYANVVFDKEMDIDLGGREVQIKFLGRGNTAGDAIVYLPKEKIVATGDLVVHPVPYLGGGFPSEHIETLRKLSWLEADIIVPGHGDVLRDKKYIAQTIDMLSAVVAQVRKEVYKIGGGAQNEEKVRKAVEAALDVNGYRKAFAGDDPDNVSTFDGFAWPGLMKASFREAWGN